MSQIKGILGAGMAFMFLVTVSCGGGRSSSSSGSVDVGGGSGAVGNATAALTVAERMSVVDATDESQSALVKAINKIKMAVSDLPSDSDYVNDETFVFVNERSAEAFDIVNEILCMMAQTRYEDMLNLGDYRAQVDVGQCESGNDDAAAAGESTQDESSGASAPEYEMWVVNSYRADDSSSSPQVVSFWIEQEADEEGFEPAQTIYAQAVIEESSTSTNPYGIFHMNFKSIDETGSTEIMTGYIDTSENSEGDIVLQFYNTGEMGGSFTESVTLNRSADGSSGVGTIHKEYSYDESSFGGGAAGLAKAITTESRTFNVAFNEDYFLRSDGESEVCLDRSNFIENVFRYGVYYDENASSPGDRVELNSGFPIRSGNYHGYVGYYGLWMPEEAGLETGDTVVKQQYGPGGETSGEEYQVFIAPGKLVRHTKNTTTLGDIAGVPLSWTQCNEAGCSQYRVEWNKDEQKLYKTAYMNQENWFWTDMTPAQVTFSETDYSFGFWSESLGGDGRVDLRNPSTGALVTFTNATEVSFHRNETVYPGDDDVPASFACFNECLNPATITTDGPHFVASTWEAGEEGFSTLAQSTPPGSLVSGTNYISYNFDSEDMVLEYQSEAVVLEDVNENMPWGVWMGALVDSNQLSALACDWDASQTCPWKAHDLEEYYTWETGPNNWNRLSLLQNPSTGGFLSFDAPKMVEYTNDEGTKYFLNYEGFGNLHGIPGKCINEDTGEDINCAEGAGGGVFIRWVPEFSIGDGSEVVDVATDDTYYVKALDKEQQMIAISAATCNAAGLALDTLDLPDSSGFEDPGIGDIPDLDAAPAVIGGVLQF